MTVLEQTKNWPVRILIILVALVVAALLAVVLWYSFAYLAMTLIIPTDFLAHIFAWTGIGPAAGWLIVGVVVGGLIEYTRSLYHFGRKKEAGQSLFLAGVVGLILCSASYAITEKAETKARAQAAAERQIREQQELNRVRAEREKIQLDQAWQAGKLWQVVQITNRTRGKIPYQIMNSKGTWQDFTVRPGGVLIFSDKVRHIDLRYDDDYGDGYQEKRMTLTSTPITGHEPTSAEQSGATSHYFQSNGNKIYLY